MPDEEIMRNRARDLRNEMTAEEKHLFYDYFKHLSVTVRRQMPFDHYILDFYIAEAKLAVELDGSQHYEQHGREWDEARDHYLQANGVKVLRFSNADIHQRFRAVCECISLNIESRIKTPLTYK